MPNRDGSGPTGQGPMTGRSQGRCAQRASGSGGPGWAGGRGAGRGGGRGARWGEPAPAGAQEATLEEHMASLERQLAALAKE
ncbi:MAG: DUF5320 domain-containing protein [Deltaproteobacteria bacterium]|nr:DUF5320 domain-containing protein [Deltaproteobacteria bacterium]